MTTIDWANAAKDAETSRKDTLQKLGSRVTSAIDDITSATANVPWTARVQMLEVIVGILENPFQLMGGNFSIPAQQPASIPNLTPQGIGAGKSAQLDSDELDRLKRADEFRRQVGEPSVSALRTLALELGVTVPNDPRVQLPSDINAQLVTGLHTKLQAKFDEGRGASSGVVLKDEHDKAIKDAEDKANKAVEAAKEAANKEAMTILQSASKLIGKRLNDNARPSKLNGKTETVVQNDDLAVVRQLLEAINGAPDLKKVTEAINKASS